MYIFIPLLIIVLNSVGWFALPGLNDFYVLYIFVNKSEFLSGY